MSVTAAIRRMMDAGLTVEQALTAAEIAEQELAAKPKARSSGAERQARYRASLEAKAQAKREAASHVTDVTHVTGVTSRDVTSDASCADNITSNPILEPPKKNPPMGVKKKGSGTATRLPADWLPSLDDREYAIRHGIEGVWLDREIERFLNFWLGKSGAGGRKVDWPATWRNWILTAAERGRPKDLAAEPAPRLVPTSGEKRGGRVWLRQGSEQFEAWTAYRGRSPPTDSNGGWSFESEWPPGHHAEGHIDPARAA